MKAAPKTTRTAARKTASSRSNAERGNMCAENKQRLIMAALEAHRIADPDISFEDFRAEQVMAAVNKPGLTACDEIHYCDLMGHFKTLAGKEEEALRWFLRAGKNAGRQLAWGIVERLSAHINLATATVEEITAATPPRRLKRALERRAAILDHPEGMLDFAYLLTIARGKTKRPDLIFGRDIKASLAERCTEHQLVQIRNTIVNRISEREGVGHTSDRNQSQNSDEAKARRSSHTLDPRPGTDPF